MTSAAKNQNVRKVRKILEQGINVNARDDNGNTALEVALSRCGSLDTPTKMVAFLAENGANLKAKHPDSWGGQFSGMTPLMIAAEEKHVGAVRILLEHGADVNAIRTKEYNNNTVLMVAVEEYYGDHLETIQTLLEYGAEIDARNSEGETALIQTSGDSRLFENLQPLLEKGADVNIQDNRGTTALMEAARCGNDKVVELLLAHGADVTPRDREGKTAIGLTYKREKIVMAMLEEAAEKAGHDVKELTATRKKPRGGSKDKEQEN